MKNKFTKLLKFGIALFAIVLLMTNCEKENTQEEVIQIENQEPTFTIKQYSRENIEKNTKLVFFCLGPKNLQHEQFYNTISTAEIKADFLIFQKKRK